MKLLTKGLENQFQKTGSQEDKGQDALVIAKFFTPWSNWTWYATEWHPEEGNFFGLVCGLEKEWGYFHLAELEALKGPMGLRIERDLHFKQVPASTFHDTRSMLGKHGS